MMTLELQLNPPSNKATAAMIFPLTIKVHFWECVTSFDLIVCPILKNFLGLLF